MLDKNKLLDVAKSQVGYHEKKSDKDLDSKTANSGNKNYTKYAEFFDDLRKQKVYVFNYEKNPAEWCAIFVIYCFSMAYGVETATKMLFLPSKSSAAGCSFFAQYFRDKKAFKSSPAVGDAIFFGSKGKESHVGLVTKVTEKMVYTIEGNKSNEVKECSYKQDNKNIAGYGRPNWSLAVKALSADKPAEKPKEKPKEPPKPATPSKPTVATKTYVVVCPKGLNIRKSYSDSSPKIGALNYGAKIQVSKEEKGWVKLANRDGWCCIGSKGVKYLKLKK